ncbi:glycosyltransferase family 4 protein [Kaustia mangrovi]|uniref:Glycosyltransferase family 4 protein n=1 Tax=Kaustia mangrovi TaxID=2593653 RepID=A0A7S8C5A3_9HYPH|nr:glycosyltransferase [Kaustia mangrovi]QPC43675.1 glycosyltransferase family 4 protein [Kaustia mangrovi]
MSASTAHDELRQWWSEHIKTRLVGMFSSALVGGAPHAEYVTRLGLAPDAVFLGYDVVDNAHFAAGAERVRAAGEMPAMGDGPPLDARWRGRYLLASARFVPKKNLPRLIRAYGLYRARAQAEGTEAWPLVMLGDGAMRAELEALRDELGLTPHIHMPGFRQYGELPAFYGTAGAFILPSTTEQWGLVVNEAMASGLPVLVSRRCGCADTLVRDGANGWTFDPEDERAMAEVMLRVASDTARDGMGRASRQIVAQWGPDRFAEGLHAAARRALAAPARKAGPVDSALMRLVASVQDRRRLRHAA